MTNGDCSEPSFFQLAEVITTHVFHPTDLAAGSAPSFHHAVRLALTGPARLTAMHVAEDGDAQVELPGVRQVLVRWNKLRDTEDEKGLEALRLSVRKAVTEDGDAVDGCLAHLIRHPAQWLVLSTGQRKGAARWLNGSVAEALVRRSRINALVLPLGVPGFVLPEDGRVVLKRVLLPVGPPQLARMATMGLAQLLDRYACHQVEVVLLAVGAGSMPADLRDRLPAKAAVIERTEDGDLVPTILDTCDRMAADLVVMSTEGHDSWMDSLWGSHTEQVLRSAQAPLLVVPSKLPG